MSHGQAGFVVVWSCHHGEDIGQWPYCEDKQGPGEPKAAQSKVKSNLISELHWHEEVRDWIALRRRGASSCMLFVWGWDDTVHKLWSWCRRRCSSSFFWKGVWWMLDLGANPAVQRLLGSQQWSGISTKSLAPGKVHEMKKGFQISAMFQKHITTLPFNWRLEDEHCRRKNSWLPGSNCECLVCLQVIVSHPLLWFLASSTLFHVLFLFNCLSFPFFFWYFYLSFLFSSSVSSFFTFPASFSPCICRIVSIAMFSFFYAREWRIPNNHGFWYESGLVLDDCNTKIDWWQVLGERSVGSSSN